MYIRIFIPVILTLITAASAFPQAIETEADTIRLQEVEVKAYQVKSTAMRLPGSLSVVTGKEIHVQDGTNLANVLNRIPGITMQNGTFLTNRITIRGMGSRTPYNTNRIKVYLNEIPLTSSDGVSNPEDIDLQQLGRIEIVKGAASALYGSGLGGSINLFTPLSQKTTGTLTAQAGSFDTRKLGASGHLIKNNFRAWGNIGQLKSDGFRENNYLNRHSAIATFELNRGKHTFSALLLFTDAKGGIPSSLGKTLFMNQPEAAAANWKAIGGFKEYSKGIGGITLKSRFSDRWANSLTLFGKGNNSFERRPFNNLTDGSGGFGFREKLYLYGNRTEFVFGSEWINERYHWELDKEGILLNKNLESRNLLNFFTIAYFRPTEKLVFNAAAALNYISYQLTDQFQADGDKSGRRNFPLIFSPRIGANYLINRNYSVYISAGNGFSLPSPEETLLPQGDVNPEIKPEQGFQAELGTRAILFKNKLAVELTFYRIYLSNLLVTKRLSEDIFTGINAGRTLHSGFEINIRHQLSEGSQFPGKLSSILSLTVSDNQFTEFTDNGVTYSGNQLPGIPSGTLFSQVNWSPFRNFELVADFRYTGRQFLNDSNTLSNASWFLFNLKASIEVALFRKAFLTLYSGVGNLTNERYASMVVVNAIATGNSEPRYYYPGAPRNLFGGLIIRL